MQKNKSQYKIKFKQGIALPLIALAAAFFLAFVINIVRLVRFSIPANTHIAENIFFLLLFLIVSIFITGVLLFSHYSVTDKELNVWIGFFPKKIKLSYIYGIMSYQRVEESFILYRDHKKQTYSHLISLPNGDIIHELITDLTHRNPDIVYELHMSEKDED